MDGFIPNIRIINNLGARLGSISFKADKLLSAFFLILFYPVSSRHCTNRALFHDRFYNVFVKRVPIVELLPNRPFRYFFFEIYRE